MTTSIRSRRVAAAAATLCAATVFGCGDSPAPKVSRSGGSGSTSKAESAAKAEPATAKTGDGEKSAAGGGGWGTISGTILWGPDKLPDPVPIAIEKEKEWCLNKRPDGKAPLREDIVVDAKSKGVRNVFVYLNKPAAVHPDLPKDKAAAAAKDNEQFAKLNGVKWEELQSALAGGKKKIGELKTDGIAVIDQVHCIYHPHALAVQEGQRVLVLNKEPVAHNVKVSSISGANDANPNMPSNTVAIFSWKSEPQVMPIVCAIHGWMNMGAMCFNHPYFTVSDADGNFEIKNAPAGDLVLSLRNWDGKYVQRNVKVSVPTGGSVNITAKWDGAKADVSTK